MTRIVLDTNVLVSSFFGGNPRKIVDLWKNGDAALCLTPPVVEEYVAVLRRMGLRDGSKLKELLDLLASGHHSIFTVRTPKLRIVASDPDDDKFFEAAVALKADFLVSGDKAVVGIGECLGIRVVTPKEFLEIMNTP